MRSISAAFFGVFLLTHFVGGSELFHQPLSMMRDGRYALVGYILFALLLSMGIELLRRIIQARLYEEACVIGLAVFSLFIVVLTPSVGLIHGAFAFLLMATLYLYYAKKLFSNCHPAIFVHVFMPLVILYLVGPSYGAFQKSLICCFVTELNIHDIYLNGMTVKTRPRTDYSYSRELRARLPA